MRKRILCVALAIIGQGVGISSAEPIVLTISDPTVVLEVDDTVDTVDLSIRAIADTDDFMVGAGLLGGDIYTNLRFVYSSTFYGWKNEVGTASWTIEFNGQRNDSITIANVGGSSIGNTGYFGVISTWDGVSDVSVTGGTQSVIAGGGPFAPTDIIDGSLVARFIWNFNDTTFMAEVVPEPPWLGLASFALLALCRMRASHPRNHPRD